MAGPNQTYSDCSRGAGFFPAGIVGQWSCRDRLFFNEFLGGEFGRQRWKKRLLGAGGEFLRKFLNEALRRPRASLTESADSPAGDIIANLLESCRSEERRVGKEC